LEERGNEYTPIAITFDELLGLWSYEVGEYIGVADSKEELVHKIWTLVNDWNENDA